MKFPAPRLFAPGVVAALLAGLSLMWVSQSATAQDATAATVDAALLEQVQQLAAQATQQSTPLRFEVVVGNLDPRLKLAPCQRIEPYLPPGTRLWGKARIGLRCTQGARPWNVYLPVTVRVFGTALVAASSLPAGTTLRDGDLTSSEIDIAQDGGVMVTDEAAAIGRTLTRPLGAGQGLRPGDLKPRTWFAAGDSVKVQATGAGFSVSGTGQALTPGVEGQTARVRTEGGQVVTGTPVATRVVELSL